MVDWTGARYADQPTVEVLTWIDAPPLRVWELVSDIELMPRLSGELQSIAWLDGATGPAVGAKFVGRNKNDFVGEWQTISTVIECEPGRVFAWAVHDPANPMATWRFEIEPKDGGSQLSQWVRMGPGRSWLSVAIERMPEMEQRLVFRRLGTFEQSMTATLEGIKQLAES
jgi:uncharacterized protein YndB with AHSA1/START domain